MAVSFNGNMEINTGVAKKADSPGVRPVRRMAPIDPFSDEAVTEETGLGLPLVLARPALVADSVTIDSLSEADFKAVHPGMDAMEVPGARYGLRILREGYLYTVDENQGNKVSAYEITQSNFFRPFDPAGEASPGGDIGSRVITIEDPESATKPVWFAFSDVKWTQAMLEAHRDDSSLRQKHMVRFDVQRWMSEQEHEGAFAVTTLRNRILEMNAGRKNAQKIEWSPATSVRGNWFSTRNVITRAMRRRRQNDLPRVRAAALMLPDPVGFASDLEALMQYRTETLMDDRGEEYRRKTAAATAISQLECAIKDDAEEDYAIRAYSPDCPCEVLDEEADKAWARYTPRFNVADWQSWEDTVTEDFDSFNESVISPMAQAHRAWLESDLLSNYLEGNYDPQDPDSGAAYAGVVSLCIGSSQDKQACFDLYSEWLESEDDDNPLRKALAYNQDVIRSGTNDVMSGGVTWSNLPWDRLFSLFKDVTEKMHRGGGDVLAQLMVQVTGPLERLIARAASSERVFSALAMLGANHGQPFVMVQVSGEGRHFWNMLNQGLVHLSGEEVSEHHLRRAIFRRRSRLASRGVPMDEVTSNRWLMMIDPDAVSTMPAHLNGAGQLQARSGWLSQHIYRAEELEQIQLRSWQQQTQTRSVQATRAALPAGFGVLSLITNLVAVAGLHGQLMQSMAHQSADLRRRMRAQIVQAFGGASELLGMGVRALGRVRVRMARALRLDQVGKTFIRVGRFFGAAGAIAIAILDFAEGWSEFNRGNIGRAVGYGASSILGLLFLAALLGGAFIWAGVFFIIAMAISFLLEQGRPDNIQQWLERCIWGVYEAERYEDETIEQEQLQVALGAA